MTSMVGSRSQDPPIALAVVTAGGDMPSWQIRAVMIETAAAITVTDYHGNQVTTPPLAAGIWHPMSIKSVDAASGAGVVMVGG